MNAATSGLTASAPAAPLYEEVFRLSPEPIWLLTPDRFFIDVNAAGVALLGAESSNALIGRDILSLVHESSRAAVLERFRRLRAEGTEQPLLHLKFVRLDGRMVDLEVRSILIHNTGEPRILSCARDITARLQHEAMLATAERIARIGNWSLDLETGHLAWSDEVFRIFGLDRRAFGADFGAFFSTVHPDDRDRLSEAQEKALAGEGPLDIVHRIVLPDKTVRHVHERAILIQNNAGRAYALAGFAHDITEEHLARERLARSEALLRAIFDSAPIAIAVCESRGGIRFANPRWRALLDGADGNATVFEALNLPDRLTDTDTLDAFFDEFPGRLCPWSLTREGVPLHLRLTGVRLDADADAEADSERRYILLATDITVLREREEQLRRKQAEFERNDRLLTAGTLAAGISHEVMQPLSATLTYLQGMRRLLDRGETGKDQLMEPVKRAAREARRAVQVLQSIRNLLRERSPELRPLAPKEVVADCVAELSTVLARRRIVIVTDWAEDLPTVAGDRLQLMQVVRNLLQNAAAALQKKARGPRRIECTLHRHGRDQVMLTVKDNGPGIDPKIGDDIWRPLVTTSDGIGMGLPICRRIVESHGGSMTAASNDEGGATFTVVLPAGDGDTAAG